MRFRVPYHTLFAILVLSCSCMSYLEFYYCTNNLTLESCAFHRALSSNLLSGTIPSCIVQLTKLNILYVGNNSNPNHVVIDTDHEVVCGVGCRDLSNNHLVGNLTELPLLALLPIKNGSALADNRFDCPLPKWAPKATPCYSMYHHHSNHPNHPNHHH
jgi:hypothetical protein